jgi:hypothetical protein
MTPAREFKKLWRIGRRDQFRQEERRPALPMLEAEIDRLAGGISTIPDASVSVAE